MLKPKSFFRVFTESGPLIALAVAVALLVGIVGPASAQFFNFGGPSRPPPPRSAVAGAAAGSAATCSRHSSSRRRSGRRISSRAPPPAKRDASIVPERNVLVLGDAMADWLAYGLEDAYSEQPDMGVIRKHKTVSGLIKYQPRGEPSDWAAAAKGILASEKPDAIVVMLGLNDRAAMREPAADKSKKETDKKNTDAKTGCQTRAKPTPSRRTRPTPRRSPRASRPMPTRRRCRRRRAVDRRAGEERARRQRAP